ncbi:hypothetical protein GIB67_015239 [Kingdonia uniflora]|uniref:Ig-like domain-containing protein n=1 Tax=Kingdonia uniflora TaxID=39325 RepID=A0A7J7MSS9_9MAGN|nr:hypothetical protein GIB67_015239 [Kingdonia uniflora]
MDCLVAFARDAYLSRFKTIASRWTLLENTIPTWSLALAPSLLPRLEEDEMEFDMIGINASIANTFWKILIAELPIMAIEKVGPLSNLDPRLFEYMPETDTPNEKNTIVFKLNVQCGRKGDRLKVESNELKWIPNGSKSEMVTDSTSLNPNTNKKTYTSFSCSQDLLPEFTNNPITPKHEDIIISKLGPRQGIELEAHAMKSLGKCHAKWSPVCTTWYRILRKVVLLQEEKDEKAEELVKKCPLNVFDIEGIGKGRKRATLARPRLCTLCWEYIRGDDWEKRIALRRVKDHFIFRIKSVGALPPEVLFTEAIKILEEKYECVITELT